MLLIYTLTYLVISKSSNEFTHYWYFSNCQTLNFVMLDKSFRDLWKNNSYLTNHALCDTACKSNFKTFNFKILIYTNTQGHLELFNVVLSWVCFISVINTSHIQLYLCSSFQHKIAKCITFISYNICVTNDHGYFPLVVNTSRSFPHSWLITGFVTKLTLRVPLVEQELLTLPEHLSSPPFLMGIVLLDL